MAKGFINFEGQVALVTGAGSPTGIGFNAARIIGECGGKIAVVATTERIYQRVEELEALGIEAKGYIANLMDRQQVNDMVKAVIADFGKIDVLVNNAGMVQVGVEEDFSGFLEMTYESWDDSIDRNLNIPFNVTKAVLPYMVEANYGRIVNTSSVTGPIVSNPGEGAYSAAKAAILGMSRAIAIEFGDRGITINNVLPGWIGTAAQTEAEAAGGLNTPLRRSARAEEVANAIVFLASKEASYITGEAIVVDGGNTIQEYKGPSELYY
ncbi:MAG: SDR family NAD(P)-dependent oxidoreductase [Firmicutes bacterium]|nr:SDR family NAD(P)-dependent oxidoreductase [Bacillota bacterium]